MKVVSLRPFFAEDLDYIKNNLDTDIEFIIPEDFSEENLMKLASDADVLFGAGFNERIIKNCKNLKFIQVPWTGVDNLDFDLLSKYNITICNSHSNAGVVAEHAIALMLDGAKKISYHDRLMRQGAWNRPSKEKNNNLSPFSKKVFGSNVGIIGYGAIGKKIAQYLKSFACNVTCYNRNGEGIEPGYRFRKLQEYQDVIAEHDFIFLSIALTDDTRNLVNNDFLMSLDAEAVLINVSRGEVISETHLYHHLVKNRSFVACLDTWYQYPNAAAPKTYPSAHNDFHLLPNIVMSPHRAGMISGELPHLNDAIENLNRYKSGQPLMNIISLERRY